MSETILYFAYGSNMSPERLLARTPSASPLGVGILPQRRLRFHKLSRQDGTGKCDVPYTGEPGDRVYGVLYSLHREELPILDAVEGVGMGYERESLPIIDEQGQTVTAETYVATLIRSGLKPFCWYREHVLRGARRYRLPEEYIAAIEETEVHKDPDPRRRTLELAVYE